MILVVDIGNSRIKWAYATGHCLVDPGEIPHEGLPATALQAFDQGAPADVERILAVNVAGEAIGSAFTMHAERRWGLTPQFAATAREAHGVRCGYADPSRLGADRWVALIAAYRLAGGAACVIDAGTAVTLDAVDVRGRHLGGLILAGPKVVAAALDRRTSGIGETRGQSRPRRGVDVLGVSTDEAVAKGAMLGLAGALDRALAAVATDLGVQPAVYITGGDAVALSEWLETRCEYRRHLVLEGLACIAAAHR